MLPETFGQYEFITGRNEVVAKVIFLHLSVILFTGGGLPQCMLGYHQKPQAPPSRPPRSRYLPPPREADSIIRSMSDRYASYWNAFLFVHSIKFYHLSQTVSSVSPPQTG